MDTNSTSSTKSPPEDSSPSPPSPSPPPADDQPPPSSPPPADDQPPPSSPPPSSSSPPPSSPPPSPDPPENTPPPPLPSPPPSTSSPPPPSPTPTVYSPPPPEEDAEPPPEPPIPSPSFDTPLPSPPPSPPPPPTQTQDSPPSPALTPPPNSTPSDSIPSPDSQPPPPPPPTTSLPLPAPPPPPPDTFLLQPSFQGSPPPPVLQSPILPPRSLTPPTNKTPITQSNLTPSLNSTDKRGLSTVEALAIGVVVGSLLICIIGTTTWWWLRKRRRYVSGPKLSYTMPTSSHGFSPKAESMFLKVATVGYEPCPSPSTLNQSKSAFTYEELAEATNGFSEQNVLGKGGFGSVYKGCLPDGRYVAVKELNLGGGQGEREFRAEVDIISRVHHRHLVSLVGYCISEQRRLLIYDYVPNDTLHFHLHGEGRPVLAWEARVKIAIGAARGIAYLHEDCHPRIIHRDIKSSNILLGENFEAQVADFGLAKLCPDTHTHVSTRVMGTFGYMAPEYASSGKLTEKSDVFSYGVVLLELITGRKPVDTSKPVGEDSLVEWARPLLHSALQTEEYEAIVDPRLKKNYVDSELCQMIEAAAACVRHSALKRPRMTLIVRAFDGLSKADLSNGMRVGESEMFNPVQHSAEVRLLKLMAFGSQQYSTDFYSQYTRDSEKGDSEESYYIPR